MASEFCDGFKVKALDDLIASEYNGALLKLYKATGGVGHAMDLSSFTEADFSGYAPIALGSWPAASLNGAFRALSEHPPAIFTQSGTGTTCTVFGWYLTDDTASYLIAAEANPAGGTVMNTTGLTYVVTLTLGDTNLAEP